MGVNVIYRGFKRNLTQLTGRYDEIGVHLYVLMNRVSTTEPLSATCVIKTIEVYPRQRHYFEKRSVPWY